MKSGKSYIFCIQLKLYLKGIQEYDKFNSYDEFNTIQSYKSEWILYLGIQEIVKRRIMTDYYSIFQIK